MVGPYQVLGASMVRRLKYCYYRWYSARDRPKPIIVSLNDYHEYSLILGMAISRVFRVTRPDPPLLGRVQEHGNWGWAGFRIFLKTRIGVGCSYNLTRPAPNMKLQLCPPLINISFSFQVFFSQFSFLSTLGFFLPLNAKIHQIIHSKIHQIFASSYSPYLWPTIPGFCGVVWTISLLGFISRTTLFRRHRGIIGGWCMSFQRWVV